MLVLTQPYHFTSPPPARPTSSIEPSPPPPSTTPTPKKMSTILRTVRNLRRIGIKDYLHQMQNIGDTKAGTLIATDRYGNKYYENVDDELPLRTRWVDYKEQEYSP
ncbi:MAG: hypothetical protein LQ349_003457, partial [Xanthoria aureola]